jgi:Extensin-like protein C-terminus
MAWGARWYLVCSIGLGVLGVLAGCSGGNMFAEREPWRREAEVQCLNAGTVREGPGIVRIRSIQGPGVCGADFPFKVSILGESSPLGYTDDPRPPGDIPGRPGSAPARWPVRPAEAPPVQQQPYQSRPAQAYPRGTASDQPVSLEPPSVTDQGNGVPATYDFRRPYGTAPAPSYRPPADNSPRDDFSPEPYERRPLVDTPATSRGAPGGITRMPLREPPLADAPRAPVREVSPADLPSRREPPPVVPLGPAGGAPMAAFTPVSVSPAATLACPIVSELDRWITNSVQPASMRWFGAPVAEITQISAYSCRGMNGNPRANISEHAFGNALDISAFTLADGRKITVKNGWRGLPEEQGFLRDVQAAACDQFTTVLAPGSNVYHYDHMHVDLMRRRDGHRACNPRAVSGEEVAARAGGRHAAQRGGEPAVTGSLAPRRLTSPPTRLRVDPDGDERWERALPMAEPGQDGQDDN